MANLHRNKKITGMLLGMLVDVDFQTPAESTRRILEVLDVLRAVRKGKDRYPLSRSQLLRATKLSADRLDAALERLEQHRLVAKQELSGRRGRPSVTYAPTGRVADDTPNKVTWDGIVLDVGIRESLCWDMHDEIQIAVAADGYVKETALVEQFRNWKTVDGGRYGVKGVRAHIEDLIEGCYIRRLSRDEARELLRSKGRMPDLLVLDTAKLHPAGRAKARPWEKRDQKEREPIRPSKPPVARDMGAQEPEWSEEEPVLDTDDVN